MAQRKGNYRGTFNRCERPGCHVPAAKWSVYSDRMLCNACLSFEWAAYAAQEEHAAEVAIVQPVYFPKQRHFETPTGLSDAAELEAMEADYADEYETRRDLLAGSLQ